MLEKLTGIISFQNLEDSSPQVTVPVVLFSVWRAPCPGIFQIQFQGRRFHQGSLEFSGVLGAANDFLPESFKFFCDFFFFACFSIGWNFLLFPPTVFSFPLKTQMYFFTISYLKCISLFQRNTNCLVFPTSCNKDRPHQTFRVQVSADIVEIQSHFSTG